MKSDTRDVFFPAFDNHSSERQALAKLLPPARISDRMLKAANQDKAIAEIKRRVAKDDDAVT